MRSIIASNTSSHPGKPLDDIEMQKQTLAASSPVPTVTRGRLANTPLEPPHKSLVTCIRLAPTPAPTNCKIRQIGTKCGSQTAVRPAPDTCGQHSGSQLSASREVQKNYGSHEGPLFLRLFFKISSDSFSDSYFDSF